MRFKLDENLGARAAEWIKEQGHDAETVRAEGLGGGTDEAIFAACVSERRCLVTLDLDFADIVRFSPHATEGIVVLRAPRGASRAIILGLLRNLCAAEMGSIAGSLWIVEPNRIRVREPK